MAFPPERRVRWTDGFDADQLGVFRGQERDCDGCGASSPAEVKVTTGWRRGRSVTRRLRCGCGRAWWQISIDE